ncbi:50S ribosomal protein L5 [Candidatus Gottesmanbacteria bacterium]|nr:50S ribosomal protein L5 [Candidatus Gottesmanbacteria bacterium]
MAKLQQKYKDTILKDLQKELKLKNIFAVPRLQKIVLNTGLGEALGNKKVIDIMSDQLSAISGQKPAKTVASRAIATFKLQKGDTIGLKVTLRGKRMFDFLEKLINIVLPRIRDFRGVDDKSFDGRGNFTFGFSEQIVFPEIEYSKIDKIRGLEVTIVTTGSSKEQTKKLLEKLGVPFKKMKS